MIHHYAHEFFALFALNFINLISPGPETALMIHNSSRHSRRIGFFTGLGIVASTIIHKSYTLLGFGKVISKSPMLFTVVKIAGSLYLFYLGLRLLLKSKKTIQQKIVTPKTLGPLQAFKMGFLMDILHPQASIYFLSIFTATVSTATPFNIQIVYAALLVLTSFTWYTLLSCIFSLKIFARLIEKIGSVADKITGVALIYLAIRLVLITNS